MIKTYTYNEFYVHITTHPPISVLTRKGKSRGGKYGFEGGFKEAAKNKHTRILKLLQGCFF